MTNRHLGFECVFSQENCRLVVVWKIYMKRICGFKHGDHLTLFIFLLWF